jgi:hypothetical protein
MTTKVRLHRAEIYAHSHEAARKLMRQLLYEVEFLAKIRSRGPYSVGNLSLSIHSEGPDSQIDGVSGRVGSRLPYAASAEAGAEAHPIFPKGIHVYRFGEHRRPMLKFFWRKAGRVVLVPQIPISPGTIGRSHPGQKGKRYLESSLRDVAHRHRMRVVTFDL